MFSKGSRYRNLSESSPINADGERLRGKDLRIISPTPGRFLHTVLQGDRLDLLAFKYYGDATKWWQISDANPEFPFPTDLLDQQPVVKERFVLKHLDFEARFEALQKALSKFGIVMLVGETIFLASSEDLLAPLSGFAEVNPSNPDFLESVVAVIYDGLPLSRQQILGQIQNEEFHFLRAFACDIGANTTEAFTFDDPKAKSNWQSLVVDDLTTTPGMLEVRSIVTEATLDVVYNNAMVSQEQILSLVELRGFEPKKSSTLSRIGAKIFIPPNQIV